MRGGREDHMWGAALAEVDPAAEPSCVFARPDGGGPPLTHAYAPGGAIVDATITLSLVNDDGAVNLSDLVRFTGGIGRPCP